MKTVMFCEQLGCNMSIKLHCLHADLDLFDQILELSVNNRELSPGYKTQGHRRCNGQRETSIMVIIFGLFIEMMKVHEFKLR